MPETDDFPRAVVVLVVGDQQIPLGIVGSEAHCDLALLDEILRMQLVVARRGWSIRLADVDDDLRELVVFVGLSDRLGL